MAGDWIKMRTDLSDDPAVIGIAARLGMEADHVVGKLHRIWSWADKHTKKGDAQRSVTVTWLDRYVTREGFAEAMIAEDWLRVTDNGLVFPRFERHSAQTGKARALAAKRMVAYRARKRDAERDASDAQQASPEKRREEKRRKTPLTPFPPFPENIDTPEIHAAFEAWLEARPKKAKTTKRAMTIAVNKLAAWGPAAALEALENAAVGGWQGLFPPNERKPHDRHKATDERPEPELFT